MTSVEPGGAIWGGESTGRIVARGKRSLVILEVSEVWAFEARNRLCFVHSLRGRFDVDVSLLEIEANLGEAFVRVHRGWLANLANVRELEGRRGVYSLLVANRVGDDTVGMRIPVSKENAALIKRRLLAGTIGLQGKRGLRSRGGQPSECP